MSHTSDELYKQLNGKEPTRYEMLEYGWALKELAEGVTGRSLWEVLRHVDSAERYLKEFRGKMVPTPDLSNKEANLAAGFHTYMRKGMDCPLGTMLYHLIANNQGTPVWFAFVKSIAASKDKMKNRIYHSAIKAAEDVYRLGNQTSDGLMMLCALRMWEEDFNDAVSWVRGDDKEGEAGTA